MKNFTIAALLLITTIVFAQVPKKIVVEHFTNTKCSICANANPTLYSNLAAHPQILHLAIHPSSPYVGCLLSQQNDPDNDDRTNYYNVYGGSPVVVVQGAIVTPSQNYSNPAIFAPYEGQTSPFAITINQQKFGADSIQSTITVKTVAAHSYISLKLFAALAEDTVFYTSPNGESLHHDVFRKSLFDATGMDITAPATVGDSLVYEVTTEANPLWNLARIYTMAILQVDATKEVVQAEAVDASQGNLTTGLNTTKAIEANIYPNPTTGLLTIQLAENGNYNLQVISVEGKPVVNTQFTNQTTINLSGLPTGLYSVVMSNASGRIVKRIIKQ